jgi:mutual gliding-motility protein MglA
MAVFNYQKKEIDAKIVYYGPGISGKTTNLQHIHQHLKPEQRGKMVSLATDEERTLFFDFLPIELESVRGFRTRFHLYTVPGQVYYGATRRAVLTGADGIIFVADSQRDRMEDNLVSIRDLEENLHYYGRKIETIPLVIQYNKRDLPNVLPLEELNSKINRLNVPHFESVAILGKGVFETLTLICRMVLKTIEEGTETRKPPHQPPRPVAEPPARRPQAETRPSPASPALAQASGPPPSGLRLEGSPSRVPSLKSESPRVIPGKAPAAEKPRPAPEPAAAPPISLPKRPFADLPGDSPRASKIGQVVTPRVEEDQKRGNGKSFLSRMFGERKAEPAETPAEKLEPQPEPVPESLRIASCGQPRISESGCVEIPLTVEVGTNGQGKTLSVRVKLEVNLDSAGGPRF